MTDYTTAVYAGDKIRTEPSPFHIVQEAHEQLSKLEGRFEEISTKLIGPRPSATTNIKTAPTPGVFGELRETATIMNERIARLHDMLSLIEQQLP